jgi:AmmeMemoRadiSam system protein A
MLTLAQEEQLLRLARRSLEARVRRLGAIEADVHVANGGGWGAFVTISSGGELRGCLGRSSSDRPLSQLIDELARAVADSDPRFDPVRPEELPSISLEVSVLGPEREIVSISEIEIGRHGLVVEQGTRRGLLLPQVPGEHGWDRAAFVEHTCLKAGLARDAWQRGARLFVFEAHVFGEGEP